MANRVGKYKLSKKETALSLADGGIVTNTLFARGYAAKAPSITQKFPAHTSVSAGAHTVTVAELLTGILSSDPTADRAWTLPTATLLQAGIPGCAVGDCIDFSIINTGTASADEIITLAAGSGGTLVGSGAVLTSDPTDEQFSSGSGLFRIRITATTGTLTYHCYRLA